MDTVNIEDLRKRMSAKVRDEIENLDPSLVFAKYGTHYIASAYLGGRADYTSSSVISDKVSASSLRMAVEAEYKAISGKGEINTDQKKVLQDSETKTQLRVVGGNARYVNNIRDYDQSELINLTAVSRSLYIIQSKTEQTYWDLAGYHGDAQKMTGKIILSRSDRVNAAYEGADRFIKVIPNPVESGWVFLQPQHSNYVADIEGGSKTAGASIWLWDMAISNPSGQFKLEAAADEKNTFFIQSRVSGLYLEPVAGGKINENGANLWIWDFNNGAAQQFQLEYASGPKTGQLFQGE